MTSLSTSQKRSKQVMKLSEQVPRTRLNPPEIREAGGNRSPRRGSNLPFVHHI
jgi:hypothetical protein